MSAHSENEKTSAGNAAAMREALMEIVITATKAGATMGYDVACGIIKSKAKHALSAPPRNCDVGTAEKQTKRFSDFCAAHRHTDLPRCAGCPLENTPPDTGCSFAWAQMPYEAEEGGTDGVQSAS